MKSLQYASLLIFRGSHGLLGGEVPRIQERQLLPNPVAPSTSISAQVSREEKNRQELAKGKTTILLPSAVASPLARCWYCEDVRPKHITCSIVVLTRYYGPPGDQEVPRQLLSAPDALFFVSLRGTSKNTQSIRRSHVRKRNSAEVVDEVDEHREC